MRAMRVLEVAFLSTLIGGAAGAAPIVGPGAKPGVAQSWSAADNSVTLTIAKGFEARAVADAIQKTVSGAVARAEGDKVIVTGVSKDQLLSQLEKVDVPEAGDDVDAMLTSLQNQGGGSEEGSGSSIRATQMVDFSEVLGKKEELLTGKVVQVQRQQFPLVLVTVKLAQVPRELASHALKPGATITVLPRVHSRNGVVDPKDRPSTLNLGAWYAQAGDSVAFRLEKNTPQDKVWVAAAFDRKGGDRKKQ